MWIFGTLAGLALIFLTLMDGFEAILQPRRVTHPFRYARLYYNTTWALWRIVGQFIRAGKWRQAFLGIFGPFSMMGLFATWVFALIVGFALLHYSIGTALSAPERQVSFPTYLYLSGTTFFTLGYGDVTPVKSLGRVLAVIESGLGFAFLAVIISYVPGLSTAFSRREVSISLLDARAGSPPSAVQALVRLGRAGNITAIDSFLIEWERWSAELLESHLSFPVLTYYRSQHDNQSWLAALTTVLDICAILLAEVKSQSTFQAQLTFAMARHAAVDLALVLKTRPLPPDVSRLSSDQRLQLRKELLGAGLAMQVESDREVNLTQLRGMYEPFVNALAQRFMFTLPSIIPERVAPDNWQRSAWMKQIPGIGGLQGAIADDEHFD